MKTRHFKVTDSSGIGMGRSFQDQVLEYVGGSLIQGCVVLKQPPTDAKGNECGPGSLVTFDLKNLEEQS